MPLEEDHSKLPLLQGVSSKEFHQPNHRKKFQRKPQKIQQEQGGFGDTPPTIDARYQSLTCFNCGEPGHFIGICGKPKVCFICAIPGHLMDACPRWSQPHPIAKYYGSASLGLGFYHVEVSETSPSQWLNLSNCGVVRVLSGQISMVELEKELADIYCKDWPWQIKELEPGNFLVRFPPHKKNLTSRTTLQ